MKTDNLIPAAPLDRRELAPGVQLCFTRLDAPLCPPPLDWPRLLALTSAAADDAPSRTAHNMPS